MALKLRHHDRKTIAPVPRGETDGHLLRRGIRVEALGARRMPASPTSLGTVAPSALTSAVMPAQAKDDARSPT